MTHYVSFFREIAIRRDAGKKKRRTHEKMRLPRLRAVTHACPKLLRRIQKLLRAGIPSNLAMTVQEFIAL
jgi:hypothetical protein